MKTLSRKNIFSGRIIKVFFDEVELSDGTRTTREVVSHKEAVAVVAVNNNQELLLVSQHRYAVGKEMVELPAGLIDEGETPLKAAKRELKEETGYEAGEWELLTSTYTSPGSHDEKIHIFYAKELQCVSDQSLDEDERLTFLTMPFEEVLEKVKAGEVEDSKTINGILLYWAKYNKK